MILRNQIIIINLAICLSARKRCDHTRQNEIEVHTYIRNMTNDYNRLSAQIIRCTNDLVWEEGYCKLETPYYTVLLYMEIKNKF